MRILNHNAAIQLFERAKVLAEIPHETWRAIHIQLSNKRKYNAALRTHFFVKPISTLMTDTEGTMYVLEDGDIFILFRGALFPVLEKLEEQFGDLTLAQGSNEEDKLFAVLDLSLHWTRFYNLCATKAQQTTQANMLNRRKPYLPAATRTISGELSYN